MLRLTDGVYEMLEARDEKRLLWIERQLDGYRDSYLAHSKRRLSKSKPDGRPRKRLAYA